MVGIGALIFSLAPFGGEGEGEGAVSSTHKIRYFTTEPVSYAVSKQKPSVGCGHSYATGGSAA
jgi:hypothetical protein